MLLSLRCTHWRNLHFDALDLDAHTVFLVGENGQGKSNLLEAVYYLIYQSSWRPFEVRALLAQGVEEGFALEGFYRLGDQPDFSLSVKQQGAAKTLTKEGQTVRDRREFLNVQAPLIFSPMDLAILQGSPGRRRDFLDQTLTLLDDQYLTTWRCYARVLAQRNALLRRGTEGELVTFDQLFAELALAFTAARQKLVRDLAGRLPFYTQELLGEWDDLRLEYETNLNMATREELQVFLLKRRKGERSQGFSLYGPHRDRFTLKREGTDVSLRASHGQMRALVLALRLMQANLLAEQSGRLPTLLLDDILLELDARKREAFFRLLPAYEQAFFTFLPDEPFSLYAPKGTRLYRVRNGHFQQEVL